MKNHTDEIFSRKKDFKKNALLLKAEIIKLSYVTRSIKAVFFEVKYGPYNLISKV